MEKGYSLNSLMLPAVVSERFSAVLLKSDGGAGRRKGKMTTVSHPCIDFFTALFSFISFFIGENGELPRVYLAIGTSYLSPFKKLLDPKTKCW